MNKKISERKQQKNNCNQKKCVEIIDNERRNIVYDTDSIVVTTADGALFQFDKHDKEVRLLFYYRIPSLHNISNSHDKKQHMKCTVEIRINVKKIAVLAASILEKISTYEEIKADIKLLEQGKTDQIMFG